MPKQKITAEKARTILEKNTREYVKNVIANYEMEIYNVLAAGRCFIRIPYNKDQYPGSVNMISAYFWNLGYNIFIHEDCIEINWEEEQKNG